MAMTSSARSARSQSPTKQSNSARNQRRRMSDGAAFTASYCASIASRSRPARNRSADVDGIDASSVCRGELGHEAKTCFHPLELKMRLQTGGAVISAGFPGKLPDLDPRLPQRILRHCRKRGVLVDVDELTDPGLQSLLDFGGRLDRAERFTADHFQIMGKSADAQNVLQHRGEPRIDCR